MKPLRNSILIFHAIFLTLFLFVILENLSSQQRTYQGKSLNEWQIEAMDLDPKYRVNAMKAISRFGKEGMPLLIEALSDKDYRVREVAVDALGNIGAEAQDAIPFILQILPDKSKHERRNIIETLNSIGTATISAVPELIKLLSSEHQDVKRYTIHTLTDIRPEKSGVVPFLIESLQDTNWYVRASCVRILRDLGPAAKTAVPALIKVLGVEGKNEEITEPAFDALENLAEKDSNVVELLREALTEKNKYIKYRSAFILSDIHHLQIEEIVSVLIVALGDEDRDIYREAIEALAGLGPLAEPAIPYLVKLLKDDNRGIRGSTVKTLFRITADIKYLVSLLENTLGYAGAIEAIIKLSDDMNTLVRENSTKALKEFGLSQDDLFYIDQSSIQKVIIVETVEELFDAIAPNRIILLKNGIYNLSKLPNSNVEGTYWTKSAKGNMSLLSIRNLAMIGVEGDKVKILTESINSCVFYLNKLTQISIANLELGHSIIGEGCAEGVISITHSNKININNSVLFGSGTYGLGTYNVISLRFNNSVIKECTSSIMSISSSENISFNKSRFLNNRGFYNSMLVRECSNIFIDSCAITNNKLNNESEGVLFNVKSSSNVSVKNTQIKHNEIAFLVSNDGLIKFKNNIFDNNLFREGEFSEEQKSIKIGNEYKTIKIGNQIWMAENLKVTHYRNGDAIPTGHSNSEWINLSTDAYAVYNDDESNADTYGYLYNWYAVDDSRNIAPEGWHVPTDAEWKELEMALGMSESEANIDGWRGTDQGSQLAGRADLWNDGSLENNAEFGTSGFNALPGGYRYYKFGIYDSMGYLGYYWSSTEIDSNYAWSRTLYYSNSDVGRNYGNKQGGFSVRCIRD